MGAGEAPEKPLDTPPVGVWRRHWPFWVVAIPALALFLAYGRTIRFDYGADEPFHLAYVHALAMEGRLPTLQEANVSQHGPLYYALLAIPYRLAGPGTKPGVVLPGPGAARTLTPGDGRARHLLRAIQALLTVLTLYVIYCTLRYLLPGRQWLQAVPLAFVAAIPVFAMGGGVVNNDGLAFLWNALSCLYLMPLVSGRAAPGVRRSFLIGLWIGLGAAVKQTTLSSAPIALLVMYDRARGARAKLLAPLTALAGMILAGCWWPLHNLLSLGRPFPNVADPWHGADQARAMILADPLGLGLGVIWQGVVNILGTAVFPEWTWTSHGYVQRVLVERGIALTVVLLVAAYSFGAWTGRGGRHRWQVSGYVAGMSTVMLLLQTAMIAILTFTVSLTLMIGGRYVLTSVSWLAVLLLGAEERLAPCLPPRARRGVAVAALAAAAGAVAWNYVHAYLWFAAIN